jgi:hypothetical protein
LNRFGFDSCINYRETADLATAMADACPNGIDVYFDSVGGESMDAALSNMNIGGRIAVCGTISEPLGAPVCGPRIGRTMLVQRLTMTGFLATDHLDRAAEVSKEMSSWVKRDEVHYLEEIAPDLSDAPAALGRVLRGENLGKSLVQVGNYSG